MAQTEFTGAARLVTIGSVTKQSSNGRIVFPLSMPLDGTALGDLPDWVSLGYEGVAQSFTRVAPEVQQVADILLCFSSEKPSRGLFKTPDAKIGSAELKGFAIVREGDPDDPDIALTFKAYCPFNRGFWEWVGQMAGEEVYMNFPTSLAKGTVHTAPAETTLPLGERVDGAPVADVKASKKRVN